MFLSCFFAQKRTYKKRSIFWQKPWTNPFAKCRFFSVFCNFSFVVKKAFFSIQNMKKCFFLPFSAQKKHMRKWSIFWQKPWTNPFAKCRFFWTLQELHFSGLKSILFYPEYQKMFLFGFFCWKRKKVWERGRFLDKNHGLTPLQNIDFFPVCENFTFELLKAIFSIQNIKKCFILAFFAQKKHMRKRSIFWQKPWTNPFEKCRFFSVFWNFSFVV